jgi:sulfide:quinone oxidoreductase
MDLRKISDRFTVSSQIAPADLPVIAGAGFRSVICNRPDGEERDQPDMALIEAAARDAGLAFRSIPITGGAVSEADATAFRTALDTMPGPVLAYCRSGTRCTMLWTIAQFGQMPPDAIVSAAAAAGYDMAGLVAQLERSAR